MGYILPPLRGFVPYGSRSRTLIVPLSLVLLACLASTAPADSRTADAFHKDCAAKSAAAEAAGSMAVPGKDGWLFFDKELRHLGAGRFWGEAAVKASRATKPDQADPLPAILDFKRQLDQVGVELVLVPVPPKAIIYPDKLSDAVQGGQGPPPRLDPHHQEFYATLAKAGVNVIDLTPTFLNHRAKGDAAPTYCKQDTHWSGEGGVVAARQIAESLKARPWLKDAPKQTFASESKSVEITGDLWSALKGAPPPKERIPLRFVGARKGDKLEPVAPGPASPVLLLGDSHLLVFHAGEDMHARGAGLPDQLALELGIPVDVIAVRGSGATPARVNLLRTVRARPDYLKGKKVVIWCLGAREFTESTGWQKVPVVK